MKKFVIILTIFISVVSFAQTQKTTSSTTTQPKKTTTPTTSTTSTTQKKSTSASTTTQQITPTTQQQKTQNLQIKTSSPQKVLTTNILGLAVGSINANYEIKCKKCKGDNKTTVLSGSIFSMKSGDWSLSAIGVGAERRIYPQGEIFKGFYYAPSLALANVSAKYKYQTITGSWPYYTVTEKEDSSSSFFFGIGFNIGYQWIMEGGFTLGLGIGVGYTLGSIEIAGEKAPYGGFGLSKLSIDVGYAW